MSDQYDEQAQDIVNSYGLAYVEGLAATIAAGYRAAADGARLEVLNQWKAEQQEILAGQQAINALLRQIHARSAALVVTSSPDPVATRDAGDWMLDGCIAFLVERGHRDLAAEMRARIMERPEMRPDPVAAAREAVWRAALVWHEAPLGTFAETKSALHEACAALAALEKGEG